MQTAGLEPTSADPSRYGGEFVAWLQGTLDALCTGQGASVPCGDCKACCRAGYFIPVRHHEWFTLAAIPPRLLVSPPGAAGGEDYLIGTTARCP